MCWHLSPYIHVEKGWGCEVWKSSKLDKQVAYMVMGESLTGEDWEKFGHSPCQF